MIELVFVACLWSTPDTCEKRSLLYSDISPMTCLMQAQPELARWTETHPRWRVASWKCRSMRDIAQHA
ncbi:hypothetical protein [Poseidonocella sedimentorum]|uniref:Uncharacterized protein n=1 Tax=Poseidonocella sedimentorum TaxID=871652 RepID=A0A1I6ER49_9RHOB|nr:hypothetical protein [Poseidonocella sedimentorum]SFR20239.1 hypothetical protein SAMN04515673_11938 [Poseidonocella sedimentorum]